MSYAGKVLLAFYLGITIWFITLPIGSDSRADSHWSPTREPGRSYGWMMDENENTLYFCLPTIEESDTGVMCIPYDRPVVHIDDGHHDDEY
jgi:hypothetical protein